MTEQELREKIAHIISKKLCPNKNMHFALWGDEAHCYSRENFAECEVIADAVDALMSAGIGDVSEYKHRAEAADIVIFELRAKLSKAEHDRDRYARRITLLQAQKGSREGKDGWM